MRYKKIVLSGTWIVDHIKFITHYPQPGYLAYIKKEGMGIGGGPHNVGINLRELDHSLPLFALGRIGEDEEGRIILEKLKRKNIDARWIVITPKIPTSYTDVMTEIRTGRRTFFHHQGANSLLNLGDFPFKELNGSLLYLGYLMALSSLDREDKEFGSVATRLFAKLKENNIDIALDLVSMEGDIKKVVLPAIRYVDYLVINELEAERLVDIKVNTEKGIDLESAVKAVKKLKTYGNPKCIVVHFPEGAVGITEKDEIIIQPSLNIPEDDIVNTLGAGDAFFAGVLYGIVKEWDLKEAMELGVSLAGACLFWETTTGSLDTKEIERLKQKYGFRKLGI